MLALACLACIEASHPEVLDKMKLNLPTREKRRSGEYALTGSSIIIQMIASPMT